MRLPWCPRAVLPDDERDEFDLVRIEPTENTVLDQAVQVAMVTRIGDVHARLCISTQLGSPLSSARHQAQVQSAEAAFYTAVPGAARSGSLVAGIVDP